ncbi:sporulation protein YjcZ [Paenibacillus harenae]|nr:sporulation protein YjcZ [Paenibacillus harenae]
MSGGQVESAERGYGHRGGNNIATILVLFILLVIIACACWW